MLDMCIYLCGSARSCTSLDMCIYLCGSARSCTSLDMCIYCVDQRDLVHR